MRLLLNLLKPLILILCPSLFWMFQSLPYKEHYKGRTWSCAPYRFFIKVSSLCSISSFSSSRYPSSVDLESNDVVPAIHHIACSNSSFVDASCSFPSLYPALGEPFEHVFWIVEVLCFNQNLVISIYWQLQYACCHQISRSSSAPWTSC